MEFEPAERRDGDGAAVRRVRPLTMGVHAARARGALSRLARFETAFYAKDGGGRVVCLVPEDGDDGPIHARLADSFPPDGVSFELTPTSIWTPPALAPWTRDALAAGIARARTRRQAATEHPARRAYAEGLTALARWRAGAASVDACGALIGLGVGLTPSGDDALGGAAIALHVFGQFEAAARLAAFLRATARGRTSDIAWAFLDAACDGQGTSRFHLALAALVDGGDFAPLDTMGHSSGWDAMDGALAVLEFNATR
jgi:hypothetical protein